MNSEPPASGAAPSSTSPDEPPPSASPSAQPSTPSPCSGTAPARSRTRDATRRFIHQLGRIRIRLLLVGWALVVVPLASVELARVYEKQLLEALERDMRNQALLVSEWVKAAPTPGTLDSAALEHALARAARQTRTRIRIIEQKRGLVVDSHRSGPPEGPEPKPPPLVRVGGGSRVVSSASPHESHSRRTRERDISARPLLERPEIQEAFRGRRGTMTRFSNHPAAVYLFLAEPVRSRSSIDAVVYVTRSTYPVLVELYRIRTALLVVLGITFALTALVTLLLSHTISRPLERLSEAARRITAGETSVTVPIGGGGELTELGHSLAAMTAQMEAKLRYITEFAADVAHAFKSPLTSIRGAAELLEEGAAENPTMRERFLKNIELDAHRLDRLVSRLLVLSRIDATQQLPTIVDLRQLVQTTIRRCQSPDEVIRLEYETPIVAIKARGHDLETALLNLLENALRHSPAGSPITLRVTSTLERRSVEISITNRGARIPEEHHERLFQRFFTTESDSEGTGLGLAIVKSVAEAHRGTVRLATEYAEGTRFELSLPIGLPLSAPLHPKRTRQPRRNVSEDC